jgi:curved DNA-binding protein CbpA
VAQRGFVDYYEVLQLSPNATAETIERVYRLLAKRYHPDNQATGNVDQFALVQQAYEILSDPARRAQFDVRHDEERNEQVKIFDRSSAAEGPEHDRRVFHGILSVLYVARRRDPQRGGLGEMSLERMLGIPLQHLEFPLWYLKERGWIERLDNGKLAITVAGIDKMSGSDLKLPAERLLTAPAESSPGDNGRERQLPVSDATASSGV